MANSTNSELLFTNRILNRNVGGLNNNLSQRDQIQFTNMQIDVLKNQNNYLPSNFKYGINNDNLPIMNNLNKNGINQQNVLGLGLSESGSGSGSGSGLGSGLGSESLSPSQFALAPNNANKYQTKENKKYDPYEEYLFKSGATDTGDQRRRITSNFVNIDSSLRQTEPSLTIENPIVLGKDPLEFRNDSFEMFIRHPEHNFSVGDAITITNVFSKLSILRTYLSPNSPTFEIPAGFNFMKIFYNHNIPLNYRGDTIIIQLNDIQGDRGGPNLKSFLGSIPINQINTTFEVKLTLSQQDINGNIQNIINKNPNYFEPDPDYFFVILEENMHNINPPYYLKNYNFKLIFQSLAGIPLNQINATYPLSPENLNGFQTISTVQNDGYTVTLNLSAIINLENGTVLSGGGTNVTIAKVLETNQGYPNPNHYRINLGQIFNNILAVRLISTEIPNTEKAIREFPLERQNNMLYWNNIDDGDFLYSLSIPSGNYTPDELTETLENQFVNTPRITSGTFTPKNIVKVNINVSTNLVTFEPFKEFNVSQPIIAIEPEIPIDPNIQIMQNVNYTLTINNPGHGMVVPGEIILIKNAISTNGIPAEILNGYHKVSEIVNNDIYKIVLNKFNLSDLRKNTRGGVNVYIYIHDMMRLRFDQVGTLGVPLGFRNPGSETSITKFSSLVSNQSPYEFDIPGALSINTNVISNKSLQLCGENYIIMVADPLFTFTSIGEIKQAFAKILLCDSPGKILYNSFVPMTYYYDDPLHEVSNLDIAFYNPDGTLFDFNGINHSFTLEIITVTDIPEGTQIDEFTGRNYNIPV